MAIRLALYGAALAYLFCDLHFCSGPLHRKMRSKHPRSASALEQAREHGTVAVVYGLPVSMRQLERAMTERALLDGLDPQSLSPAMRKLLRHAALDELIEHEILRMKVKVSAADYPAAEEEIEQRFQRYASLFTGGEDLANALANSGLGTVEDLRLRLAARIQQEKYTESRIGPKCTVSEEEAREWFEQNKHKLILPERIRLLRIFLPSDPDEPAPPELKEACDAFIWKFADFSAVFDYFREISSILPGSMAGDEWLVRTRLPEEIRDPVFSQERDHPVLLSAGDGWHLVIPLDHEPARQRTFEEAREEITATLETLRRRAMTAAFRTELRKHEDRAITIYTEILNSMQ